MADLLEDFKTFFVTAGLVTSDACFSDSMLDGPDSAVCTYEYGGNSPVPQIGAVVRSIQVVARDKDALMAKTKADALYRAIITEAGILHLTPSRWTMTIPRSPASKIRVDAAGRNYFGFNLAVTTYND